MTKKRTKWTLDKPLHLTPKDKRYKEFCEKLEETGISPDELWNLDTTIVRFIIPRLKLFRELMEKRGSHPGSLDSNEQWLDMLDKMILGFRTYISENFDVPSGEEKKRIDEGFDLFNKYFGNLWD